MRLILQIRGNLILVLASLVLINIGCTNKRGEWIKQYTKTKCAFYKEQEKQKADSVAKLLPIIAGKSKLESELALFIAPYEQQIKEMNEIIRQSEKEYMRQYRKETDEHSTKYGHVSTPAYEATIEKLKQKKEDQVISLKQQIENIRSGMATHNNYQIKVEKIKALDQEIKYLLHSIEKDHKEVLDSLGRQLYKLNQEFNNINNHLTAEDQRKFELQKDNIEKYPCKDAFK